jgi:short-subunit dehydrogenase
MFTLKSTLPDLSGQTAFITGASAGIGREFALQMHSLGASLVLMARRKDLLEDLSCKLNKIRSGSTTFLVADLVSDAGIEQAVDYINRERIDILVNNAGRGSFGRYETLDLATELQMIDLNIRAPLILTRAVIPQMKQRKKGAIIILSSVAGLQPLPFMATYGATKAFDLSFGMALAQELKPFKVRVLSVLPGPTATEFGGVARVPGEFTNIGRDVPEQVVKESLLALAEGRHWVVPCLKAKMLAWPSRVLPLRLTTGLTSYLLKGALRSLESTPKHIESNGEDVTELKT